MAVVICLVTGAVVVTSALLTDIGLRTSDGIPFNLSWGSVPKAVLKVTSWKLNSEAAGFVTEV